MEYTVLFMLLLVLQNISTAFLTLYICQQYTAKSMKASVSAST